MNSAPANPFTGARLLLVDDSPANLAVLTAALEPEACEILAASNGADALRIAARARPDLILLDVVMPDLDGFETCRQLRCAAETRDIPVIFLTARNDPESVVAGFRAGGVDYIIKPFRTEEVLSRAATHLRLHQLARELLVRNQALELRTAELTAEIERRREAETARRQSEERLAALADLEASRWNLDGLLGASARMGQVIAEVRRLHAFPNTTVLITGESGTGKELIARALHHGSPRAAAPFVAVNCAAIPPELAESTLFGHTKGAFTGAHSDRKGCFEQARGGTLFLDEIGDMPVNLQTKLLRVLEDGLVTPVGGTTPRRLDLRIIAATNARLETRIASGTFRQDLYFRLARYTLQAPPLRDRREDIPLLARHFLRHFASEMGLREPPVTDAAIHALLAHDFPGNVRELRNVVERALIHSEGGPIGSEHLQLPHPPPPAPATPAPPSPSGLTGTRGNADRSDKTSYVATLPISLAEAEELLIQRALQMSHGNIADAARLLGVHRTRIYRRLTRDEPATPEPAAPTDGADD